MTHPRWASATFVQRAHFVTPANKKLGLAATVIVIMEDLNDYIDLFESSLAPDRVDAVKERLEEVLGQMHQKEFVHGDVCNVNEMARLLLEVKLVDFDWAGKIGEGKYPISQLGSLSP